MDVIDGETAKFGFITLNNVNTTSFGKIGNLPTKKERKNKKIGKNTKIANAKYLLGTFLLITCLLGTFIIS
ncbi:hypothetical protein MARBORIA2_05940 [Methanobrevibacter arboriphilus]|nr:hypothetical protein MARBORIA2_05940 [Methanobrevibacter arboriphilus]